MDTGTQVKLISSLKKQRSVLGSLVAVLVIANLLLAVSALMDKRSVVIMPAHVFKDFEISNKGISEEYLELMGRDFIQSFLNITPESQKYIEGYILRIAHPHYYGALKEQIQELFVEIESKQISLHFTLNEMTIDKKNMTAIASGYLVKYMGSRQVESKLKKYQIVFMNNNTRVMLKEFYEVSDENQTSS